MVHLGKRAYIYLIRIVLIKSQFPLLIVLIVWWFSGLQLPPVMNWLKNINETVADTFGKALPALPTIPNRMRLPV